MLSCSDATGPVATVSATVTSATTSASGSLDALLDVELTNATSMEIRLVPCAMSLERENIEGEWDQVWSLLCSLLNLGPGLVIPAAASKTISVRITAHGNGATWPSGGLDGNYRLKVHFFPPDALIKRMVSVTDAFTATPVVSNEFEFPIH